MRGMRDNNISRRISFLETNIPHGGKAQSRKSRTENKEKRRKPFYVLKISSGGKAGFVVQ